MVFITNWGEQSSNYFLHFIDMEKLPSLTQWAWVWASSGRWWRTGRPIVLQSMGSQRVQHDWATEQTNKYTHIYVYICIHIWASLVAQVVKNLPAMQDTWVWSLCEEDPLEKGMATYSSIVAWRIPQAEEPGWLQAMGSQRVGHGWVTDTFTSLSHTYIDRKNSYTLLPFKENQQCDACFSSKFSIYFFQCNWYLFIFSCLSFLALYCVCILDLSNVLQ